MSEPKVSKSATMQCDPATVIDLTCNSSSLSTSPNDEDMDFSLYAFEIPDYNPDWEASTEEYVYESDPEIVNFFDGQEEPPWDMNVDMDLEEYIERIARSVIPYVDPWENKFQDVRAK